MYIDPYLENLQARLKHHQNAHSYSVVFSALLKVIFAVLFLISLFSEDSPFSSFTSGVYEELVLWGLIVLFLILREISDAIQQKQILTLESEIRQYTQNMQQIELLTQIARHDPDNNTKTVKTSVEKSSNTPPEKPSVNPYPTKTPTTEQTKLNTPEPTESFGNGLIKCPNCDAPQSNTHKACFRCGQVFK